MLRRYQEAKATLERLPSKPFWVKGFLAACCGQLGEVETAKRYWDEAKREAPAMNVTFSHHIDLFQRRGDTEQWIDGLRLAGITV